MTKKTIWIGEIHECQVCYRPLEKVMYDARTGIGIWGNICEKCFKDEGCRLGPGFGQKYELQGSDWVKVAG